MRFALLMVCVIAFSIVAQKGQLTLIESRDVSKSVRVFRANSAAQAGLQARSVIVQANMPTDRTEKAEVFVLFDPAGGFFQRFLATGLSDAENQSGYLAAFASNRWVAYADGDGLAIFQVDVTFLAAIRSAARASSVNDAEAKALNEATKTLPDYARGVRPNDWRRVSLLSLGKDFVAAEGHAQAGPIKIMQVSKQDGNWVVVVQAQWKEKVVLNDKFELVEMSRVD